jgi:hypothetical protein
MRVTVATSRLSIGVFMRASRVVPISVGVLMALSGCGNPEAGAGTAPTGPRNPSPSVPAPGATAAQRATTSTSLQITTPPPSTVGAAPITVPAPTAPPQQTGPLEDRVVGMTFDWIPINQGEPPPADARTLPLPSGTALLTIGAQIGSNLESPIYFLTSIALGDPTHQLMLFQVQAPSGNGQQQGARPAFRVLDALEVTIPPDTVVTAHANSFCYVDGVADEEIVAVVPSVAGPVEALTAWRFNRGSGRIEEIVKSTVTCDRGIVQG